MSMAVCVGQMFWSFKFARISLQSLCVDLQRQALLELHTDSPISHRANRSCGLGGALVVPGGPHCNSLAQTDVCLAAHVL